MKNWTNKKVMSFGLGIMAGFMIMEYFFSDPVNWIKPIIIGFIAIALLFLFRFIAKRN